MTIVVPEDNNYARINYDGTVLTTIDEVATLHCKYYVSGSRSVNLIRRKQRVANYEKQ